MANRKDRKNPWTYVITVVVIGCLVSYGLSSIFRHIGVSSSYGRYSTMTIRNLQDLQTVSGGFVYYDGSTVAMVSSSGKTRWSYMLGSNADFAATDDGVAAWTERTITLIDAKTGNTTYNSILDENILNAYIGPKYTAIVIGEETNSTIILMENGGKIISRIIMEDIVVIDLGFFSNGSLLWVMVCDSNGTVPACTIRTYKPGKEIVGSISDNEQLTYAVVFQSSQICVAGNEYLKVYDYTGTETLSKRKLIYGWYFASVDESSENPLMALVKDSQYSGESDVYDVRMIRSNLDRIIHLPFGCMDVIAKGDAVYGFSADGYLMAYGIQDTKANTTKMDLLIDKVYGVTENSTAVVGYGDTVYLIKLK